VFSWSLWDVNQNVSRETSMKTIQKKITVKDHLVSGESFEILWDSEKAYAQTKVNPNINLDQYYPPENYASHVTKRTNPIAFIYSFVKSFMLQYKTRLIKSNCKGNSLLDIGGGIGSFAAHIKKKGFKVAVVEPNLKAKQFCESKGLSCFSKMDEIEEHTKFSIVTLWHALEHIADQEAFFKKLSDLLTYNGYVIIAVPSYSSYDAQYYAENWAALDVPRHLWHFTPEGLINKLKAYNFSLVKQSPLWFDALYISYLSEKYRGSKMPFIRGILIGIFSNTVALFSNNYSSNIFVFKKMS